LDLIYSEQMDRKH